MKRASAPSYDLFKTIVPVILALILILMLLSGCATNVAAPAQTETIAAPNATETIVPSPVPPTLESTSTPTTAAPSPKSTSAATKQAKADAPTPTAASAAKEPPTPLPDAASPAPDQNASCNTSLPSRLSVGQTARVVQRLNMRSEASITAAILQTNPIGTQVEIIGGPVCTPVGRVAYRWWQIRLADGAEGWSTESQIKQASYFLEPVQ